MLRAAALHYSLRSLGPSLPVSLMELTALAAILMASADTSGSVTTTAQGKSTHVRNTQVFSKASPLRSGAKPQRKLGRGGRAGAEARGLGRIIRTMLPLQAPSTRFLHQISTSYKQLFLGYTRLISTGLLRHAGNSRRKNEASRSLWFCQNEDSSPSARFSKGKSICSAQGEMNEVRESRQYTPHLQEVQGRLLALPQKHQVNYLSYFGPWRPRWSRCCLASCLHSSPVRLFLHCCRSAIRREEQRLVRPYHLAHLNSG